MSTTADIVKAAQEAKDADFSDKEILALVKLIDESSSRVMDKHLTQIVVILAIFLGVGLTVLRLTIPS